MYFDFQKLNHMADPFLAVGGFIGLILVVLIVSSAVEWLRSR
jgi:hypothetical protein